MIEIDKEINIKIEYNKIEALVNVILKEARRQQMHPLNLIFALELMTRITQDALKIPETQISLTQSEAKDYHRMEKEIEDQQEAREIA